jgi:arylformamidase
MNQPENEEPRSPLAAIVAGLSEAVVHDVSPVVNDELPVWFLTDRPRVTPTLRHEDSGVAVNVLSMSEHTGSHIDAPFHCAAGGQTMAEVSVDALLLRPFCKYDLTANDHQPGELIGVEHLQDAEARAGFTLQAGDVAVLETGWDKYLPGGAAARDAEWWGRNQPGLSEEACEYLAGRQPVAIASDTAACDVAVRDGDITSGYGHAQVFLPRGILIVEGLHGLANVPATGLFLALPLKIADGTGSPARVVMVTEKRPGPA